MAALDFPSAPSVGQEYSANDGVWVWDGTSWLSKNPPSSSVSVTTTSATTTYPSLFTGVSGIQTVYADSDLSYNASTNAFTSGVKGGTF